jgi:hypothetical protein
MLSRRNISSGVRKSFKQIEETTGYSTKHILIGLVTVLVVIGTLYWLICKYKTHYGVNFKTGEIVPVMKRPFLNLYVVKKDGSEVASNIIFISHHFTRPDCNEFYNEYKSKGAHFLGISSYSQFPGQIENIHDVLNDPKHDAYSYDYFKLTRGWCSVFREENNLKWFPKDFPRIQLGESEFGNFEQHLPDPNVKKEYDFLYICLSDGQKKPEDTDCPQHWQSVVRSWSKTKNLLDIMCKKHKLRGLLVGRVHCEVPANCHQLMELTDFQEYSKFITNFNKCKFILTCSEIDASPRTLTEALCFNLPCLVNKKILGGWQYVNDMTGEFIDLDDLKGFEIILDKFLKKLNNNEYKPRQWFIDNYGKYNSGKKLKEFVQSVFKEDELNFKYEDVDYMKPGI